MYVLMELIVCKYLFLLQINFHSGVLVAAAFSSFKDPEQPIHIAKLGNIRVTHFSGTVYNTYCMTYSEMQWCRRVEN